MLFDKRPSDEEFTMARVYNTTSKREYVSSETRHTQKKQVTCPIFSQSVHQICTKKLSSVLKTNMENFHSLFPRESQMEWLRYTPDMFFKAHRDFEKYVCNDMIPYVLLIGMYDVEEGGETRVGDRLYTGGARRNGAVFFRSDRLHEACVVKKGIKLCLKMEFYVFVSPSPFRVMSWSSVDDDDDGVALTHISYWKKDVLRSIDNFIASQASFKKTCDIRVQDDTSSLFYKTMMMIVNHSSREEYSESDLHFVEMMFPNMSIPTLHDIFIALNDETIVTGQDPDAWTHLVTHIKKESHLYLVGLWTTSTYGNQPQLFGLIDQYGRDFYLSGHDHTHDTTTFKQDTCHDYTSLCHSLIRRFILKNDIHPERDDDDDQNTFFSVLKDDPQCEKNTRTSCDSCDSCDPHDKHIDPLHPLLSEEERYRIYLSVSASVNLDTFHDPDLNGVKTIVEYEMCNDDASGYDRYVYDQYVSYRLSLRWIRYTLHD